MKIFDIAAVIFLMALSVEGNGQDTQDIRQSGKGQFRVNNITLQTGYWTSYGYDTEVSDLTLLTTGSTLLNDNSAEDSSTIWSLFEYFQISSSLGFEILSRNGSKYKTHPIIQLGVSYLSGSNLGQDKSRSEVTRYDTLVSTQTGQAIFLDSITGHNIFLFYNSRQIRFDGSIMFRTNPNLRLSFFYGIGTSFGISFNSTKISRLEHVRIDGSDKNHFSSNNSQYIFSNQSTYETEKIKNKNSFCISTYIIPIGIDLRLGNRDSFAENLHLFYELRAGLNFFTIPELTTQRRFALHHSIGFRWYL
jgi:hypothetical protein